MTLAYVCLGRYGDICNTLPMALEDSRIAGPVSWIVAEEFASVLDGCSYVRPVIWHGDYSDMQGAVRKFSGQFDELRIVQPWSANYPTVQLGDSFCRSAWAQIGRRGWPGRLVFDRRDADRECLLALDLGLDVRRCELDPPILLALDSTSSPFAHRAELVSALRHRFGDRVVILEPKANLLYDLCGLFERAACLVTVDTAHLHLSWAVPRMPVVCLIADRPTAWHGSARRPNQVFRQAYSDFDPGEIVQAVDRCLAGRSSPRLIHCYSDYVRGQDARARHARARATWDTENAHGPWLRRPCAIGGRRLGIRTLPLVRDILDITCAETVVTDQDLLVLTNDDTLFEPGISESLLEVAAWPTAAAFAHRLDIHEGRTIDGQIYPGVDLFAMSVRVWREWRQTYPDCVIGAEQWDLAMLALMRSVGAPELAGSIAHVPHMPAWVGPAAVLANAHNRVVCGKWFSRLGITADQVIENVI